MIPSSDFYYNSTLQLFLLFYSNGNVSLNQKTIDLKTLQNHLFTIELIISQSQLKIIFLLKILVRLKRSRSQFAKKDFLLSLEVSTQKKIGYQSRSRSILNKSISMSILSQLPRLSFV